MDTMPVLTVADDPPFVDRVADKVRALATVKPALVRLFEWQIDQELERVLEPICVRHLCRSRRRHEEVESVRHFRPCDGDA
jgi:hypothetical protein